MRNSWNAIGVGILAVAAAVAIYFTVRWVDERQAGENPYSVFAIFPDATGLNERTYIAIAGIKVGSIDKISLIGGMARVDMKINGDIKLYEDAALYKSAGSILGEYFLVLNPGSADRALITEGGQIKNLGEQGLFGALDSISRDIKDVTGTLSKVLGSDAGEQQLAEIVLNLTEVSRSVNEILKQNKELVHTTIKNVENITDEARPGIVEIVENLRDISADLREIIKANKNNVGSAVGRANEILVKVDRAVDKLNNSLESVETITKGLEAGEGTAGRLLKDETLINEVEGVVQGAGDFVDSLVRLQTIVELRSEYYFQANSLKSALSLRLQPREDKYYLIEVVNDPRGKTTRTETVVESTHPDDPPQWREVRHSTSDTFLFSLMFARRISLATFRFGIKESTGGLGMDIHLLKDRLEFYTDLYDFGADVYPRFKETMALEFLRHLYVIGGVDDVFNEDRDYFVGMMLRFNDRDLKSILTFSPVSFD